VTRPSARDGLLVVDKPAGWTSHDVVARARRLCATRKVGHAGTLDPMATGVLVLGVGRATRLLTFLVGSDKSYAATVRLGQTTVTDDAEGEVTASAPVDEVTEAGIRAAVSSLTGEIEQVPSAVSAIKVDGVRSYRRVRSGEDVDLPARPVTVSRLEVRDVRVVDLGAPSDSPGAARVLDLDVEADVSSGTYVRALARDLGHALDVGGHLTALRRTRVGPFTLEMAHRLADLEGSDPADVPIIDMGVAARAALPARELSPEEARALGHGQRIPSADAGRTEPVAAIGPDGRLVAVLDESADMARARVVLAPAGS
jgi:tRNA pseudouridine55 synthase